MRKTKVKRGEKLKNQKAITLIALVITITVTTASVYALQYGIKVSDIFVQGEI